MKLDTRPGRRFFAAGAVVLVVVALMLVLGVVPAVKADTHPGAAPGRAALAFLVNAGIALVAAVALLLGGPPLSRRGCLSRSVLVALGLMIALTGLALVDAAAAFRSHGPGMKAAVVMMAVGAAGEILVGALTMAAAFRRPRGEG